MAVTMLAVRPSCRKNRRWPTPHSGALRNSSAAAPPCGTPSASAPMLCTAMSENGSNVALLSGAKGDGPVVSVGVWQSPHPTAMKTARPAIVDADPSPGDGGPRKRMNAANKTVSPETSAGVPESTPPLLVWSSGDPLNTQPGTADRSLVKFSFETPCSTLYASPAKIISDLFCAFQPNFVTVPSFPDVLSRPETGNTCGVV